MKWFVSCCTWNCPHEFIFDAAPWDFPTELECPTCLVKQDIHVDESGSGDYWFMTEPSDKPT